MLTNEEMSLCSHWGELWFTPAFGLDCRRIAHLGSFDTIGTFERGRGFGQFFRIGFGFTLRNSFLSGYLFAHVQCKFAGFGAFFADFEESRTDFGRGTFRAVGKFGIFCFSHSKVFLDRGEIALNAHGRGVDCVCDAHVVYGVVNIG